MTARDWALLLALSVLWGASFLFAKVAVTAIAPLVVVLGRVGLAAVLLGIALVATGEGLPRGRARWLAFLGMGLLNNVIPFSLIFWAQQELTAGFAAILNATTPLFTVIVAHLLTSDEKATPARVIGVLTGFAGVAIMLGQKVGGSGSILAVAACLGGALSYAFSSVFARRFRHLAITPMSIAFGQLSASSVVLAALVAAISPPALVLPPLLPVLAVIGLATFSTALAYIIFFRVLASAGPVNLMLVTLLIPVSALLFGVLLLDEALVGSQIAGMAVIAIGLAIIDGRLWRRLRGVHVSPSG